MKMIRIFLLVLAALFGRPTAQGQTEGQAPASENKDASQTIKVTVVVKEMGGGRVIKRAEVRVGKSPFYTDPSGQVEIEIPQEGAGSILVTRFRFESTFVDYSKLRAAENGLYEVFLFPGTPGDNEVYIRGEKRPDTSKKSLSISESARVAPGGDPAQVTKLLPGVQAGVFGSEIAVRGSGPEDSAYRIDNWEVFDIFHGIGNLSVLPEQMMSGVDFYAGGFGAQYGNATGGVVILKTKTEQPETAKTEVRINLPFYSALYHERPLSESSWMAGSARYSYLQYVLPLFISDSSNTVVPYFGDAHMMYMNKDASGGHLKFFMMGTEDGLELLVNDSETGSGEGGSTSIDIYDSFATIAAEKLNVLGKGWSLTSVPQVLYNRVDNKFFERNRLKWDFYGLRGFMEARKKLSRNESIYVGWEAFYGEMWADLLVPKPIDDPLFDFEEAPQVRFKKKLSFYWIDGWASFDKQLAKLIVTPGVRYRYDGQMEEGVADPRLLGRYLLSDNHTLKGAYGLYTQSPQPVEATEAFGNPDLDFEKSIHHVLGVESKWGDRWETDIQLYYKRMYDRIVSDSETVYSNKGSSRSKGAEVFIRRNLTDRAFGWLSYTYSETEARNSDEDEWRNADFDQTHVATLASSYRLTSIWDLGSRFTYRTGDTYTPINDTVYNSNLDKYQPRQREEDTNSKRLPDYHQIDLWTTVDILFNRWKLAVRTGVQYLSFTDQVYARDYNYDYTKEEDFTSLPPIPFIEVRGEF